MDLAIVGVDGLDPTLLNRWRSDLSTLNGLCSDGSVGRLRSSDPPLSSPAWPTLYTGKQGGKHGVFGFTKRRENGYERVPVNYDDVQAESIWEILDDAGVRCGVANVPLTYPPPSLDNGFVLSGWPVPNKGTVSAPAELHERLESRIGGSYEVSPYPLTLEFDQLDDDELFDRIRDGLRHHNLAFRALLEMHELDVFFCVHMGIDVGSHNFAWDEERLKALYVEQDRLLDELLDDIPDGTDVILVSDHGHGVKGSHSFHVNEWLRQEGYLSVRSAKASTPKSLLQRIGLTQAKYVYLKNALGVGNVHELLPESVYRWLKNAIPERDAEGQSGFDPSKIDWAETVAYSGAQNEIFLNTLEHPNGIVRESDTASLRQELKSALLEIPHPEAADEPLVSYVATKDEVFDGPFYADAPDLVFVADEMRCNAPVGFANGQIMTDERWGEHRQHGTLITAGPSFQQADTVPDADITDILPLALALLNVPMPDNVDGAVPADRFRTAREPETRPSRDNVRDVDAYSAESTEAVREQLEGLGYLK